MQNETKRRIFVISDLHLGGEVTSPCERGFRICTHEPELISFINGLTALHDPAIELVINGDIVDFLAEETGEKHNRWSSFHFPESKALARPKAAFSLVG